MKATDEDIRIRIRTKMSWIRNTASSQGTELLKYKLTCDGFGFARLSHHVYGLSHSDGDGQRHQVRVEGDQHARLHRRRQAVQQVVRLPQNGRLGIRKDLEFYIVLLIRIRSCQGLFSWLQIQNFLSFKYRLNRILFLRVSIQTF